MQVGPGTNLTYFSNDVNFSDATDCSALGVGSIKVTGGASVGKNIKSGGSINAVSTIVSQSTMQATGITLTTTPLAVGSGGTGLATLTSGQLLTGNGTGNVTGTALPITVANGGTGLATLTSGALLTGNGTSSPTFTALPLTVANGGTGATTLATGNFLQGNGTSAVSSSNTMTNAVTLNGGLLLQTTGGTATNVNYYEETTMTTGTTGCLTLASQTLKLMRIGNWVHVTWPTMQGTTSGAATLVTDTAIPARYRPLAEFRTPCHGQSNALVANCVAVMATTGFITFSQSTGSGVFLGAAVGGPYQGTFVYPIN